MPYATRFGGQHRINKSRNQWKGKDAWDKPLKIDGEVKTVEEWLGCIPDKELAAHPGCPYSYNSVGKKRYSLGIQAMKPTKQLYRKERVLRHREVQDLLNSWMPCLADSENE